MEPIFKELLLAKTFEHDTHDVSGWIASEKLDGVRAYWDGKQLWSRQKKIINAPLFFLEALPKNTHLDGELFMGRKSFQSLVSIVRKKIPIVEEWNKVQYHIFDIPFIKKTYKERVDILKTLETDLIKPVNTWSIKDNNELLEQILKLDKEGAEGIMVRNPDSFYEFKRSNTILKVKTFYDSEAIILDHTEGNGRLQHKMGALKVMAIGDLNLKKDTKFKIGTGFTDDQRLNYKELFPKGTVVTFKYTETTKSGTPRFPVFIKRKDSIE